MARPLKQGKYAKWHIYYDSKIEELTYFIS
jgi:hypothetical protein